MKSSEHTQEELRVVMNNVMAALNTFGVRYHVNIGSTFDLREDYSKLTSKGGDTLAFEDWDGGKNFETAFKKYLATPGYDAGVCGYKWAEVDDEHVAISVFRMQTITDEIIDDFVSWCGCTDYAEAQCVYGDYIPSKLWLTVVLEKAFGPENFLRKYGKYFWM